MPGFAPTSWARSAQPEGAFSLVQAFCRSFGMQQKQSCLRQAGRKSAGPAPACLEIELLSLL